MQKYLHFLVLIITLFLSFSSVFADCVYQGSATLSKSLEKCAPKGSITSDDYKVDDWVKKKVVQLTNQLILLGSILSVGGIVFASALYVSSLWDAEKVKHAKTSMKFAIVGFVVMLLSFPIVNALVNLIYEVGK